jgi:hypothetical protein
MKLSGNLFRFDAHGAVAIVLVNILPVFGVLFAGWDIYTLLITYWCETLIVGFWAIVTIGLHEGEETPRPFTGMAGHGSADPASNPALAILPAGFLLALHLFLTSRLYGGAWPGHLNSVSTFIDTFLIGQGIWSALAVFFVQRAAICWQDRKAPSILPTIAGLNLRVTVMQFVIIFGAGGVILSGSGLLGLVLLAGLKTLLDLRWPRLVDWVVRNFYRR